MKTKKSGLLFKKCLVLCLFILSSLCVNAVKPSVTIYSDATNVVVTEEVSIKIDLVMPPLPSPHDEQMPIFPQHPPHFAASFLEPNWESKCLTAGDLNTLLASRRGNDAVFTLNEYVSNSLFSMGGDPFSFFNDDPFERFRGRKQRFAFSSSRVEIDGTNCWRFTINIPPYKAKASGSEVFAPVMVEFPLAKTIDKQGRISAARYRLKTKPLTITVSQPPTDNQPDVYCGAIGSNLTVKATFDTNICTAGDPLILTMEVGGVTDLGNVLAPDISESVTNGIFKVDAASVKTDTLPLVKRFTWRVRALKAGTWEFPALPIAYFNVKSKTYETVFTQPFPMQVKAGAQATLLMHDDEVLGEEEFPLPDALDIDENGARALPLVPNAKWLVLAFFASPLFFLLCKVLPPLLRKAGERRKATRKANAFKQCRKILESRASEAKKLQAIRKFFEVRYEIDGATITAADVKRIMRDDFSGEECELISRTLNEIDATNYSSRTSGKLPLVILSAMLTLPLCGNAKSQQSMKLDFAYQRATHLAINATDAKSFEKAADAYLDCIEKGAANETIYLNLSGCYYFAGKYREAMNAATRAERIAGESVSSRRAMRAGLAKLKNDARMELPLMRVFLKPHFMFSTGERAVGAVAFWVALWLMALLPKSRFRNFSVWMFAILFLISAVSVSISIAGERLASEVVYAEK